MDWTALENTLHDGLVHAVTSALAENPDAVAAALAHLYRETDGVIMLPSLGVATAEDLATDGWSIADWDYFDDAWLPTEVTEAVTAEACSSTPSHWDATFQRYLEAFVQACRRARTTLDLMVVFLDDEHRESLIRAVLAPSEVSLHFPEYDARDAELARLAAKPVAERAVHLVSQLDVFDGPVQAEPALRELGPDAFPALIPLLTVPGTAWQAAKLIADIGRPDGDVLDALEAALDRTDGSDRNWVAMALARLGRLDTVLDRAGTLPADTVADAIAAPYTGFRDDAVAPPPLDYRQLEDALARFPAYASAVKIRTACTIRPQEVDEARRGLVSPHGLIREHAAEVLDALRIG
ncbi:hypothetical protein GCM10010435_00890 [Winogradskya consettensis]|uniref:Uncharacterized protein n=1 Tax=Winogradskya consettensis TaxID=113560 RepID=A0A919S6S7_9ACTN|nr:DUF4303 domain-containing protein [Actinoplanes consettensis]GIM66450.1 hypothetical protein Aco04nite_02060 [Actinoplanes consettensis]